MKIAFVGCGAAGRALARLWLRAGHEIGAIQNRSTSADAVVAIGAGTADGSLDDADVVVFATPDDALSKAASDIALRPDQVAIHLSGALPSTVLQPTGARVASLHPLRAFASIDVDMSGTWCFVEGDVIAEQLARDLGAEVARIETDRKLLYHAGAAIASNYLVTLFDWARRCFRGAGIDAEDTEADAAILALMRGTLDNVAAKGAAEGLTGPIARGDLDVIQGHLAALPEAEKPLYCALLEATIPLGLVRGTLDPKTAKKLADLAFENRATQP